MPNTTNRITIAGNIYHQNSGDNPSSFSLGSTRPLPDDAREEVWNRCPPKGIGPEWKRLSLGWIDEMDCSLLALRNESDGVYGEPSWEDFTIEICEEGGEDHPSIVPPGLITIIYPRPGHQLQIRSRKLVAKYTVLAIPE
jgi:hypothetical protein